MSIKLENCRKTIEPKDKTPQSSLGVFIKMEERKKVSPYNQLNFIGHDDIFGNVYVPMRTSYPQHDFFDEAQVIIDELNDDRVLICPSCSRDVELVSNAPYQANFCECKFCGVQYFIFELIIQKSFRLKLEKDKELKYYE